MAACFEPGKTDVAPQHEMQCIDLIEFRQTNTYPVPQVLLRGNNKTEEACLNREPRFAYCRPAYRPSTGGRQAPAEQGQKLVKFKVFRHFDCIR
jgi:hypothetical protein